MLRSGALQECDDTRGLFQHTQHKYFVLLYADILEKFESERNILNGILYVCLTKLFITEKDGTRGRCTYRFKFSLEIYILFTRLIFIKSNNHCLDKETTKSPIL